MPGDQRIALVAAVARGGVIGRDGGLPWHLPEDMRHFRATTMGHAVVMGRRTWESLPAAYRPLPGRRNIVLTRNRSWRADGAETAESLEEALRLLAGEERVFVVGGAEVYAATLSFADELILTEIDVDVDGDAQFPPFPRDEFELVSHEPHLSAGGTPYAFATYARREPA